MGQAIVKAARDRDLYLIWSSEIDNAIWVGLRDGLIEHLRATERQEPGRTAEERVARADRRGTSMLDCDWYGWDHEALTVGEGSPPDGWYHIRRDRLVEYAGALLADDEAAAVALLECWQRHDEPD